eukprot:11511959-Heterocapsa_arctica.AAC.1
MGSTQCDSSTKAEHRPHLWVGPPRRSGKTPRAKNLNTCVGLEPSVAGSASSRSPLLRCTGCCPPGLRAA